MLRSLRLESRPSSDAEVRSHPCVSPPASDAPAIHMNMTQITREYRVSYQIWEVMSRKARERGLEKR